MTNENRLRKGEWRIGPIEFSVAKAMVAEHHYARGGSNTFVYMHALYRVGEDKPMGLVWWLPPTRVACESVNRPQWKKVLALSRMVVLPEVPKNAASFLLASSVRRIKAEGRFVSLVTYADESQGHKGGVYRSANWTYVGKAGPYPRWIDPVSGRQIAPKATTNRTKLQMQALGYVNTGSFYKHKYVLHLPQKKAGDPMFLLKKWLCAA